MKPSLLLASSFRNVQGILPVDPLPMPPFPVFGLNHSFYPTYQLTDAPTAMPFVNETIDTPDVPGAEIFQTTAPTAAPIDSTTAPTIKIIDELIATLSPTLSLTVKKEEVTVDEDDTAEEEGTTEEATSAPESDTDSTSGAEESSDTEESFKPGKGKIIGIIIGVFIGVAGLVYVYRDYTKVPEGRPEVETAAEGATAGATEEATGGASGSTPSAES